MYSGDIMENMLTRTLKHVGSCDFHKVYVFIGICITPNVKLPSKSVNNYIWDNVNLFCLFFIILKIKIKLTVIRNRIKLAFITDISLFSTFTFCVWSSKMHLGYMWRNGTIVLFMARSKRNQSIRINVNK